MITMQQPLEQYEPLLWQMSRLAGAVDDFATAYAAEATQLTSVPESRQVMDDLARLTGDLAALQAALEVPAPTLWDRALHTLFGGGR